jgi:hypothetical protein
MGKYIQEVDQTEEVTKDLSLPGQTSGGKWPLFTNVKFLDMDVSY